MSAPMATCGGCGTTAPLDDMFGIEPDLRCPACAAGVRARMQVRKRTLLPDRPPRATAGLLAVAAVVFVITDLVFPWSRDPAVRPAWVNSLYQGTPIWLGEVWRHATSTFVHGGFLHLAMNGLALWQIGRLLEMGWGSLTLLAVLLGTGIGGTAIAWSFSAPMPNVGLSGGIFGLCGFLWALVGHHSLATAVMNRQMKNQIVVWFVLCLILTHTGTLPISNAGHGGGFVLGFALGLVSRQRARIVPVAAIALLAGAIAFGHFVTIGKTDGGVSRADLRAAVIQMGQSVDR